MIAVIGGLVGAAVGAVVAVNVVIFSGIDSGYETSIAEVFDQKPLVGVITVFVLAAGTVGGVLAARGLWRQSGSDRAGRDET